MLRLALLAGLMGAAGCRVFESLEHCDTTADCALGQVCNTESRSVPWNPAVCP